MIFPDQPSACIVGVLVLSVGEKVGSSARELTLEQRTIDRLVRQTISTELGHGRTQIYGGVFGATIRADVRMRIAFFLNLKLNMIYY